jgi:hypothetical protein
MHDQVNTVIVWQVSSMERGPAKKTKGMVETTRENGRRQYTGKANLTVPLHPIRTQTDMP